MHPRQPVEPTMQNMLTKKEEKKKKPPCAIFYHTCRGQRRQTACLYRVYRCIYEAFVAYLPSITSLALVTYGLLVSKESLQKACW